MRHVALAATLVVVLALPAQAATPRTVTEHSSGHTIVLGVGQRLNVKLRANDSTPYRWDFTKRPNLSILRFAALTKTTDPHPPGLVGVPGHYIYRFKALRRGTTSLKLAYHYIDRRSPVATRFTLTVKVR
jgi:predicted secreted protein